MQNALIFQLHTKPRNYPLCIIVENGRAVKESTPTGGIHMKSGTYRKTNQVFVNINDSPEIRELKQEVESKKAVLQKRRVRFPKL